uniref:Phage protein n=1 Tax=Heterorhabditis bacteriophora TaxID=37862 RepID=A0A1I7W8A9_HETBA
MYWIRPFSTGIKQEIRDLKDFISRNEIDLEFDYKISGWEELRITKGFEYYKIE